MAMASPQGPAAVNAVQQPTIEEKLLQHHKYVVGAITKKPPMHQSKLVKLYNFHDVSIDNRFLKNITGIAEPAVCCSISINSETAMPSSLEKSRYGYDIYFTFNRLLLAPMVRLECRFYDLRTGTKQTSRTLRVALEFHFNDCDGQILRDFQCEAYTVPHDSSQGNIDIQFSANGATCSGLTNAIRHKRLMSDPRKQVVDTLRDLADPEKEKKLSFSPNLDEHSAYARTQFKQILERLPGRRCALLPSLDRGEWAFFRSCAGGILRGEDAVQLTYQSMRAIPPQSMVPIPSGNTFCSL